jgi:hypothetical protein
MSDHVSMAWIHQLCGAVLEDRLGEKFERAILKLA